MPLTLPCDACSFRRVKCDGKNPCSTCLRREQSCTYLKVRKRRGPKGPRKSTNARVQAMQKSLGFEKSCSMRDTFLSVSDGTSASPELSDCSLSIRRQIPLSTYYTYVDIFRSQLYSLWLVISTNALKAHLSDGANTEADALAAALCAATLAQLRLPNHTLAGDFVRECLRMRTDYQSNASLDALFTSLFLHIYYANVEQTTSATFALRDAITHAHLMHLGNVTGDSSEGQLSLRVYWILLIAERTFCFQHGLPTTLQTIDTLQLPVDDHASDPALLTGTSIMIRLFARVDGPLSQRSYSDLEYPKEEITDMQRHLQTEATQSYRFDEIQRVDIWATAAWLSSLLWQYSASHFMLTSESDPCPFFAPSYPFHVARTFLSQVCGVSMDSIRSLGYTMETKLFQLANSLADVLVYVPSLSENYEHCDWGPRHALLDLEHLLENVFAGRSERLDILRKRMAHIEFSPSPPSLRPGSESDGSQWSEDEMEGRSELFKGDFFSAQQFEDGAGAWAVSLLPELVLPEPLLPRTELEGR